MGGLGCVDSPTYAKSAVVAMVLFFTAGYGLGWAAVTQTLNAELCSTNTRDFTFRTASVTAVCTQ